MAVPHDKTPPTSIEVMIGLVIKPSSLLLQNNVDSTVLPCVLMLPMKVFLVRSPLITRKMIQKLPYCSNLADSLVVPLFFIVTIHLR